MTQDMRKSSAGDAPSEAQARAEIHQQIKALLADAQALLAREGVSAGSLKKLEQRLALLAGRSDLFSARRFPFTDEGDGIALYELGRIGGDSLTLYLNVLQPHKQSRPHDHTIWAVIAAVQGQELNRVYRRTDDGTIPDHAALVVDREVVVQPGVTISFMPHDIHSIHGQGEESIRHLHLYGRPLENLTERKGYDLEANRIVNYNRSYMTPAIVCDFGPSESAS